MNHTLEHDQFDPYATLDLLYTATEQEIQEAFQVKIEEAQKNSLDLQPIIQAYGMLRQQSGRNQWRWDEIRSFLALPYEKSEEKKNIDTAALAKELAFLSSWELGDDTCLN